MKKLRLLSLVGITLIALTHAGWAAGQGGGGGGFGGGGEQAGGGGGFGGGDTPEAGVVLAADAPEVVLAADARRSELASAAAEVESASAERASQLEIRTLGGGGGGGGGGGVDSLSIRMQPADQVIPSVRGQYERLIVNRISLRLPGNRAAQGSRVLRSQGRLISGF